MIKLEVWMDRERRPKSEYMFMCVCPSVRPSVMILYRILYITFKVFPFFGPEMEEVPKQTVWFSAIIFKAWKDTFCEDMLLLRNQIYSQNLK